MGSLTLVKVAKGFVASLLIIAFAQSVNAASLIWQDGNEDWDNGVILGVADLYVASLNESYDVTFVDGYDPLPVYGITSSFQGELYPNAKAISGFQLSELRSYLLALSTPNIDSRLINGINDTPQEFQWGRIQSLYQYNQAGLGQMYINYITIFSNSSDMAIGNSGYSPDIYETYYSHNTDNVWALFEKSGTPQLDPVPEPTTMLLFGAGIAGLAAAGRRRK